jgi:hypothetical protein
MKHTDLLMIAALLSIHPAFAAPASVECLTGAQIAEQLPPYVQSQFQDMASPRFDDAMSAFIAISAGLRLGHQIPTQAAKPYFHSEIASNGQPRSNLLTIKQTLTALGIREIKGYQLLEKDSALARIMDHDQSLRFVIEQQAMLIGVADHAGMGIMFTAYDITPQQSKVLFANQTLCRMPSWYLFELSRKQAGFLLIPAHNSQATQDF